MKRNVSAYLEAIFRFTNAGYIETNVETVWLDVEISSSALYSGGYTGCNRRNLPNFGRVFLMLNYTENTQNTYIQI
jgi:hypothetical protein